MSIDTEKIFLQACLDDRIPDGIFDMEKNEHMDVLRELLVKNKIPREVVCEVTNMMLDGKYPERQAYNKDGILVTFPTPQHKQDAIKRGTHFENDPTKENPNIFDSEPSSAEGGQTGQPEQQNAVGGTTELPKSDAAATPASVQMGNREFSVEPIGDETDKTETEPPPEFDKNKGAIEREAESDIVKQIIGSRDTTNEPIPDIFQEINQLKEFAKEKKLLKAFQLLENIQASATLIASIKGNN